MIEMLGGPSALPHACSRAGCLEEASWALLWQNPKIHRDGRRKVWLACDAHLEYLKDFLAARSFPLELRPLGEFLTSTSPPERQE